MVGDSGLTFSMTGFIKKYILHPLTIKTVSCRKSRDHTWGFRVVSSSTSELCRQIQNNTLLGNTEYAPICKTSNCTNKIIAHRHHISFHVVRKAPVVLSSSSFFLFLIFYHLFFPHAHKIRRKRERNNDYSSGVWKKKEEVISTTELIRDGKIAIILVLIKLHYFLDHHEIIFFWYCIPLVSLINNNGVFL